MDHLRYFIFNEQSDWKIEFDGQVFGDFRSEQEAMSKAIENAFLHSMKGYKVDILIQDKMTGQFKLAWSYGRP